MAFARGQCLFLSLNFYIITFRRPPGCKRKGERAALVELRKRRTNAVSECGQATDMWAVLAFLFFPLQLVDDFLRPNDESHWRSLRHPSAVRVCLFGFLLKRKTSKLNSDDDKSVPWFMHGRCVMNEGMNGTGICFLLLLLRLFAFLRLLALNRRRGRRRRNRRPNAGSYIQDTYRVCQVFCSQQF